MKILHYALGLPPYRTGGLTKYAIDLMEEQCKQNEEVYLLYPGKIKIFNKKTKIKKEKNFKDIKVFEIINPLPVPLLQGINNIEEYTKKVDITVYENFLKNIMPDVIHIHTLMGIHKEFFEIAKKLNIKLVFTTHDYFGLCPKVSLYNHKNENCKGYNNKDCSECCKYALSTKKVLIMQSHIYKKMKNTKLVKNARKKGKEQILTQEKTATIIDYTNLMNYYKSIFSYIDMFHFNSELTKQIYMNHIPVKQYNVLPITHKNIQTKIAEKEYDEDILKIGYMGAQTNEKGYFKLKSILDKIYEKNHKFNLNIYFKPLESREYIIENQPYNYKQINEVYNKLDIVVVPSTWNETFGFIVLEAIANKTPVIASNHVGASYIIKENNVGFVYENEEQLKEILEKICTNKKILNEWNKNITKMDNSIFDLTQHAKKIKKTIYNK